VRHQDADDPTARWFPPAAVAHGMDAATADTWW
jgi:hypothetical protein